MTRDVTTTTSTSIPIESESESDDVHFSIEGNSDRLFSFSQPKKTG